MGGPGLGSLGGTTPADKRDVGRRDDGGNLNLTICYIGPDGCEMGCAMGVRDRGGANEHQDKKGGSSNS